MQLPSLQELDPNTIYDVIMQQIDPRLVKANLAATNQQFKGLSKEQVQAKHAELKVSLAKYVKVKNVYFIKIREEIENLKRVKQQGAEQESRKDEEEVLAKLETMFK